MTTLVHSIETTTRDDIEVRTTVVEYGGSFIVGCNGTDVGHECSGQADVLIEPGDTWGDDIAAAEFAERHALDHRERPVRDSYTGEVIA